MALANHTTSSPSTLVLGSRAGELVDRTQHLWRLHVVGDDADHHEVVCTEDVADLGVALPHRVIIREHVLGVGVDLDEGDQ
ncbi:MAG: hypothetical protein R2716_02040 [Microthrixaceae bacterium]